LETWVAKAGEILPDLAERITEPHKSPMGFCSDLYFELLSAYDASPVNDDLIGRIYEFIAWCLSQPNNTDSADTDLPTAAAVGFIEDLPLDQRVAEDLHRWMSLETFKGMENLFRYHLSDEEYQGFANRFLEKKKLSNLPPRI
jgi:hypothetical protein